MRVARGLSLLPLALTALLTIVPTAHPVFVPVLEPQPIGYTEEDGIRTLRGCNIHVTLWKHEGVEEIVIIARAWARPIDVEWESFKLYSYLPKQHEWTQDLVESVVAMFGLQSGNFVIIDQGIDDTAREVYVVVKFSAKNAKCFDISYMTVTLEILDVIKLYGGSGWFDEIFVSSDIKVLSCYPDAIWCSDIAALWSNPSMDRAPSHYWITLEPIFTVDVRVEGLPNHYRVNVWIDGDFAGEVLGGTVVRFATLSNFFTISIEPGEFSGVLVRYVAEYTTATLTSSGVEVVFRFSSYVDYFGLLVLVALLGLGGTAFIVLYRSRLKAVIAGKRTLIASVPEDEMLKRDLEALENKIRECREHLAKLEQMRERGEVSDTAYLNLKTIYVEELEKYEIEFEELKKKLEELERRSELQPGT